MTSRAQGEGVCVVEGVAPSTYTRRLLHTDARDYDVAAVVAAGLDLVRLGQGADRIAVRCIRALLTAAGQPIIDDRGEQRRAILAGVFAAADVAAIARQVADLNGRPANDPRDNLGIKGAIGGWHIYLHIQRVSAPITNRLLSGGLGTVRTDGIASYTTLVSDIDPAPGAEPGVAIYIASELETVLVDIGVPREAILVMQSGRGAYLLVAIEPQPLSARPTMQLATRMLSIMIDAAGESAHGDRSVFDAPRILRVPGTRNWKPDADPTTPAWILRPWVPGVRAPWSVVERLAAKARSRMQPPLRVVSGQRSPSVVAERRPLRDLFTQRGWLYRERADDIADVRCPNADQHTDGRDAAILYPPREPGGAGWLKCSHAHCADLDLFTVYRLLERA